MANHTGTTHSQSGAVSQRWKTSSVSRLAPGKKPPRPPRRCTVALFCTFSPGFAAVPLSCWAHARGGWDASRSGSLNLPPPPAAFPSLQGPKGSKLGRGFPTGTHSLTGPKCRLTKCRCSQKLSRPGWQPGPSHPDPPHASTLLSHCHPGRTAQCKLCCAVGG